MLVWSYDRSASLLSTFPQQIPNKQTWRILRSGGVCWEPRMTGRSSADRRQADRRDRCLPSATPGGPCTESLSWYSCASWDSVSGLHPNIVTELKLTWRFERNFKSYVIPFPSQDVTLNLFVCWLIYLFYSRKLLLLWQPGCSSDSSPAGNSTYKSQLFNNTDNSNEPNPNKPTRTTLFFLLLTSSLAVQTKTRNVFAHWLQQDLNLNTSKFMQLYAWYSWPNVILCFFGGFLLDRVFGIRYDNQQPHLFWVLIWMYKWKWKLQVLFSLFFWLVSSFISSPFRLGTIIFSLFVCVGQVGLYVSTFSLSITSLHTW